MAPTSRIVRALRFGRLLLHLLRGAVTIAFVFPLVGRAGQRRLIEAWSRRLLRILRVRLQTPEIAAFEPRSLVLANHVSWLDIWLLHSVSAVCFVAKAEVRGWPLIGWMAHRSRTLFIQRERRRDTSRINQIVRAALHAQETVAIFPEGTTSDGTSVRRFNASLLQPAVEMGVSVHVLAIRYISSDGSANVEVAYADETTLWQSLQKILAHREVAAELIYLGELEVPGRTRREIAQDAEHRVRHAVTPSGTPPETQRGLPSELP
ncbi:MAG: 1-acyl-sn-glycerol-3-phosphate acyltransferase [Betaproteobacteria bacterium]|nr:1-acyl-sn-glycerol-3-phosphate acyltransferase [Betaproteobacteria bacterium]